MHWLLKPVAAATLFPRALPCFVDTASAALQIRSPSPKLTSSQLCLHSIEGANIPSRVGALLLGGQRATWTPSRVRLTQTRLLMPLSVRAMLQVWPHHRLRREGAGGLWEGRNERHSILRVFCQCPPTTRPPLGAVELGAWGPTVPPGPRPPPLCALHPLRLRCAPARADESQVASHQRYRRGCLTPHHALLRPPWPR